MLDGLRKFFNTKAGYMVAGVVALLGVGVVFLVMKSTFGETEAERFTNDRVFIDSSTGKPFNYTVKAGMTIPIPAPSGKATGYPAEMCYWTKDGGVRKEPYPVLLKLYLGAKEPTFCPDCGRLVLPHNPGPGPGVKPAPTEQEYKSSRGSAPAR